MHNNDRHWNDVNALGGYQAIFRTAFFFGKYVGTDDDYDSIFWQCSR